MTPELRRRSPVTTKTPTLKTTTTRATSRPPSASARLPRTTTSRSVTTATSARTIESHSRDRCHKIVSPKKFGKKCHFSLKILRVYAKNLQRKTLIPSTKLAQTVKNSHLNIDPSSRLPTWIVSTWIFFRPLLKFDFGKILRLNRYLFLLIK
jgi:hypothetical protein